MSFLGSSVSTYTNRQIPVNAMKLMANPNSAGENPTVSVRNTAKFLKTKKFPSLKKKDNMSTLMPDMMSPQFPSKMRGFHGIIH